jgi:hypothetical protein
MNGSSIQFNYFFPYLDQIYNMHCRKSAPITIVFSTTSASQQAYRKLYTLREVDAKPHYTLDGIEGIQPIIVMSPSKQTKCNTFREESVINLSELEINDEEKMDRAVTRLDKLSSPLILNFSPEFSVFQPAIISAHATRQEVQHSNICKMLEKLVVLEKGSVISSP